MSFGRNPYVPKAEAAEQKAADAADNLARVRALRDAAHQWDRAAEREKPGKMRTEYEARAARNRAAADEGRDGAGHAGDGTADADPPFEPIDPSLLD